MSVSSLITLAVPTARFALKDHCLIPDGIQKLSVDSNGGEFLLESPAFDTGEEEPAISIKIPLGAVKPEKGSVEVDYAKIITGPFQPPEGFQFGSMVMYVNNEALSVTEATLCLPHWYGGEHCVRDGVSFAMGPHTLREGEQSYQFEILEGGELESRSGILTFSHQRVLLAVVFHKGATSSYHASLWTHEDSPIRLCNRVVFTYSHLQWLTVCSVYVKPCSVFRQQ